MGGNRPDAEFFRRDRPHESERRICGEASGSAPARNPGEKAALPVPSSVQSRKHGKTHVGRSLPHAVIPLLRRHAHFRRFRAVSARKPDRSIFYYTTNERYLANVFHEIMRAPRRTPVPCGAEENRVPLKSGRFVFAAVSLGLCPGAVLSVFSQVREKQC